jgi:hypothetical protein
MRPYGTLLTIINLRENGKLGEGMIKKSFRRDRPALEATGRNDQRDPSCPSRTPVYKIRYITRCDQDDIYNE